jgi:hypothetical protein
VVRYETTLFDAYRDDGKRFVARADEKLTAFVELESATRGSSEALHHNQPAGPELEPSHIYHFKGRIARCADFAGMGSDNKGNRIAFGTPTTDYGFMQGEYFAGRAAQTGAFTYI